MPLVPYDGQTEPDDEAELWRFMDMDKFRDLMANQELYFRLTDLFKGDDPNEGLPKDDLVRGTMGLSKYALEDIRTLDHHQGSNRLHSECYYLSCWNLYDGKNSLRMWFQYATFGVAIRTKYKLLKAALDPMLDDTSLGKVRYGDGAVTRYNTFHFIYSKGDEFEWESEVRAVLSSYDPVGGQARNYGVNNIPSREPLDDINPIHRWVHPCKRRRINLNALVTGIAVSPWATENVFSEVERDWAKVPGIPVAYDLKSPLTPDIEGLKKLGWKQGAEFISD